MLYRVINIGGGWIAKIDPLVYHQVQEKNIIMGVAVSIKVANKDIVFIKQTQQPYRGLCKIIRLAKLGPIVVLCGGDNGKVYV